jgi:hypothetical protein
MFLTPLVIAAAETDRIELYSLKIIFCLKTGRKIILRFGTTFYETNEKVTDEISRFAEDNNITIKIIDEEI